jgi:hypothetical protein
MSLRHLAAASAGAPGRRRPVRVMLAAVLIPVALAFAGHASAAHACSSDPDTGETTCGPPPPPPPTTCPSAPAKWSAQPRVLLHVSEFRATGGALGAELQLMSAAYDVMNQFNAMGATAARITSVTSTTDAFKYKKAYSDAVPTIHVGFVPDATLTADNKGNPAGGLTSPRYMGSACQPAVTIEFPDLASTNWSFSSPLTGTEINQGARFFDAGPKDPSGATWFRPSLQHEVLHAFDLNHTATEYSMMNHRGDGGFPWANRPDHEAIRPLPDEIGLLRAAYPATGTRWDVAALDTWFGVMPDSKGGAADQLKLCSPSLGSSWSAETSSGACGVDGNKNGSTTVGAPGSTLRTRFALANYSTGSEDVTTRLWLSKDETWDPSDVPADADQSQHLSAATSALVPAKWTLPTLCSGVYHPIVHVVAMHINADGAADPASVKTDWIPLRGTITSTWGCKVSV